MDEIVMYFVARRDLKMSAGKLAAQVGHGVQYLLTRTNPKHNYTQVAWTHLWSASKSSTKIVLAVDNLVELHKVIETLDASPVPSYARVIDEGRTEVEPKTETVLAIAPMPRSVAKPYVGHLTKY